MRHISYTCPRAHHLTYAIFTIAPYTFVYYTIYTIIGIVYTARGSKTPVRSVRCMERYNFYARQARLCVSLYARTYHTTLNINTQTRHMCVLLVSRGSFLFHPPPRLHSSALFELDQKRTTQKNKINGNFFHDISSGWLHGCPKSY